MLSGRPVFLTLSNGLRAVLQPEAETQVVALHVCYAAGSRWEAPALAGLAHLCEHLAFQGAQQNGTAGYPQLVHRLGGEANAATQHDRVSFEETLPAHHLAVGLWLEAERMAGPVASLSFEDLELQRRVVLRERLQRVEGHPHGRAAELLHQLLYPADHPYHRLPIGEPQTVEAISAQDVEGFFRARYAPNLAVVALVGGFSVAEATEELERWFAPLRPAPAGELQCGPPGAGTGGRRAIAGAAPAARTLLAVRGPGFGLAGWYALSLLVTSLGAGRSRPLTRELVQERGLASIVTARLEAARDASVVVLAATAAPGVDYRRLEEALVDTLDGWLERGLSDEDVERARKKALTDHWAESQRIDRRAERLALSVSYLGEAADHAYQGERYFGLDRRRLTDLGREVFREDGRVIISTLPAGSEAVC